MRSGAVLQHAGDDHPGAVFDAKSFCQIGGQFIGLDANPAARYLPVFQNVLHHSFGGCHGNSKTDAHVATRARINRGVDAHQVAQGVNQGATRITWVDGGVCLNKVFKGVDAQLVAPQCADDAAGDSLAHAKGVANGQHLVTHLQGIGIAQHDHR